MKLPLEILDLLIDQYGEEQLFYISDDNGNTILHVIAMWVYRPSEGCSKDKWISFLKKIVDRFPVDTLSTQNRDGHTPYDCLINKFSEELYYEEVLDLFKPR